MVLSDWLYKEDNLYLDPCQVFSLRSQSDAITDVLNRIVAISRALDVFWWRGMSSFPPQVHVHVSIIVVVVVIVIVVVVVIIVAVDIIYYIDDCVKGDQWKGGKGG